MPRIERIIDAVGMYMNLQPVQILSGRKVKPLPKARALCCWLARRLTIMSYPEIAAALGLKSHSTAITANLSVQANSDWLTDAYNVLESIEARVS